MSNKKLLIKDVQGVIGEYMNIHDLVHITKYDEKTGLRYVLKDINFWANKSLKILDIPRNEFIKENKDNNEEPVETFVRFYTLKKPGYTYGSEKYRKDSNEELVFEEKDDQLLNRYINLKEYNIYLLAENAAKYGKFELLMELFKDVDEDGKGDVLIVLLNDRDVYKEPRRDKWHLIVEEILRCNYIPRDIADYSVEQVGTEYMSDNMMNVLLKYDFSLSSVLLHELMHYRPELLTKFFDNVGDKKIQFSLSEYIDAPEYSLGILIDNGANDFDEAIQLINEGAGDEVTLEFLQRKMILDK